MARGVTIFVLIASSAVVEFVIQHISTMLKHKGSYDGLEWLVIKLCTLFVFAVLAQLIFHRGGALAIGKVLRLLVAGVAIGGLLKLAHYLFIVRYGILQVIDVWASVGGFFVELLLSAIAIAAASGTMRMIMRKATG